VSKNAIATIAAHFCAAAFVVVTFGATGGCEGVFGVAPIFLKPTNAYDCACRCTSSRPTIHFSMEVCLPASVAGPHVTQAQLDADCGGRVQDNIAGAIKQCVTAANGIQCSCLASPLSTAFNVPECDQPCPGQDIDPKCTNFNPFANPPVKTATNVAGKPAVCTVATSDPPTPTPDPLAAGILGRFSNCNVSGDVTVSAGSQSQTQPASGLVNISGAACPGTSCAVGMSYRVDQIRDFSFSGFLGFDTLVFQQLFAAGATIPGGATLDNNGNGTFASGTMQTFGKGRRSNQIAGAEVSSDSAAFAGTNGNPVAIGVQWQNHVCEVSGTLIGQLGGNDTSGSADLIGTIVNEPPSANAGAPQTVECTSPAGAPITLDGSASSDPEGNIALYVWRSGSRAGQEIGDDAVISSSQALGGGAQSYFLKVVDTFGQSSEASTTVSVVDTTPPVISSVSANPNVLWPPNGKLVPVSVSVSATDTCDPNPVCTLTQISSNEPMDPDNAQITGPLSALLSARRLGSGSGRVYTLTVRCTDASGNASTGVTAVSVPHDQG
jgi:hypothetical protein